MVTIKQQPLTMDLKKQIDEGFREHVLEITGYDEKFDPIAFLALDDEVLAGVVVCQLFWGALHIRSVFISKFYRFQGLGTQLMNKAFIYGKNHNCSFAFVETMSFLALEFYQKLGFELEFTRNGYKFESSFYYLRKNFNV